MASLESLQDLGIDVRSELESVKRDLAFLQRQKTKAACFRSKCKWANEGEKATAYFLKLEKNRARARTISSLRDDKGALLKDQRDISKFQVKFYKKLYSDRSLDSQDTEALPLQLQPEDFPQVDPIILIVLIRILPKMTF